MKRSIKILGTDIELKISRGVKLHVAKPFLYLWEMNDGTWRLEYSSSFIDDISLIDSFQFNAATDAEKKKKGKYPSMVDVIATTPEMTKALVHQKLEIDRVTAIAGVHGARFIHLEYNAPKGKWTLAYWLKVIPDISLVTGFGIHRED